jgi:response regulator of citrate/malate metabolism
MKQTAVEWYFKQMQSKEKFTQEEFDSIYEQAKEIEKQQLINGYQNGSIDTLKNELKFGKQNYNEQFKNK